MSNYFLFFSCIVPTSVVFTFTSAVLSLRIVFLYNIIFCTSLQLVREKQILLLMSSICILATLYCPSSTCNTRLETKNKHRLKYDFLKITAKIFLNSLYKLWILNVKNWQTVKIFSSQNLVKQSIAFTRLFLFDQSSNSELLVPIAVTGKIVLCLREIAMATITSLMLVCAWVSHHSQVHQKMSECHLSKCKLWLLQCICACHS